MGLITTYFRPTQIPGTLLSSWLLDCLSIHGQNRMVSPLQAFPGNCVSPGLTFYGHERSGWWLDNTKSDDELVCSINGQEVYRTTVAGFRNLLGPIGVWSELESPSGTVDGTNAVFNLSHPADTRDESGTTPQSVRVYVNGVLQAPSTYTLTGGKTLTFTSPPTSGAVLLCDYVIAIN